MEIRSLLGSLQLPVAGIGLFVTLISLAMAFTMPPSPPDSEGFVQGLALLALYVFAWGGFVVLSLGLAIPPGEGFGIGFTRIQRGLFLVAALTAAASAIVPFAMFGLLYSNPELLAMSLLALFAVALLTFTTSLAWRAGQVLADRMWASDTESG